MFMVLNELNKNTEFVVDDRAILDKSCSTICHASTVFNTYATQVHTLLVMRVQVLLRHGA